MSSGARTVLVLGVLTLLVFVAGFWVMGENTAKQLELDRAAQQKADGVAADELAGESARATGDGTDATQDGAKSDRHVQDAWEIAGKAVVAGGQPAGGLKLAVDMHLGYEVGAKPTRSRMLETREDGSWSCAFEDPRATVRLVVRCADESMRMTPKRALVLSGKRPPRDLKLTVYPLDATVELEVVQADKAADAAIGGAWVVRGDKDEIGITGSDGKLRFRVSSFSRRIGLQVGARGYAVSRHTIRKPKPGETIQSRVALARGLTIRGVVRDKGGYPIAGARVQNFFSIFFRAATTDKDGRFELSWLTPGRSDYSVFARKDGYLEGRKQVSTSQLDDEHVLVLERGVRVRGRVTDDEGRPVRAASLYIGFSPSAYNRVDAMSRDDGSYDFPVVERGKQRLSCTAKGFAPKVLQIDVPEQEAEVRVDVVLGTGGSVSGRVVDTDDKPIEGIWISALTHPESGTRGEYLDRRTTSAADGTWSIDHLPDGKVQLEFYKDPWLRHLEKSVATGTSDLTITMKRASRVAGIVVDASTGQPIRKFRIRLSARAGMSASWSRRGVEFDNAEGKWDSKTSEIQPGTTFVVEAWAEGYAYGRKMNVRASAAPKAEDCVIELQRGARIEGRVLSKDNGRAVVGATVTASFEFAKYRPSSHQGPHGRIRGVTDENGSFALNDVPAGEVELVVEHSNFADHTDGPIVVRSGAKVQRLIHIERSVRVEGQVTDDSGRPLSKISVGIYAAGGTGRAVKSSFVGGDGSFSLAGIAPGRWFVAATKREETGRHQIAWTEVEVKDSTEPVHRVALRVGASTPVRFELLTSQRAPLVSLRCRGLPMVWTLTGSIKGEKRSISVLGLKPGDWEISYWSATAKERRSKRFRVPVTDWTPISLDMR